jgi:Fe-S-cluster-containing hydrogenase component 2
MISVNAELCTRCGQCLRVCTTGIFEMRDGIPAMTANGDDYCIQCQHCLAVCPVGAITLNDKTPADCAPIGPLPSSEHMLNLLRQRRSIRRFQATPVEPAILAKLQAALAWSPTGCNDHRLCAVLVNGQDAMAKFREPTLRLFRRVVKTRIPQLISRRLNQVLKRILDGEDVIFRQAPHMVVIATPKNAPCADIDPTIALAQFELYAQTFGLGTLWCGFAFFAFRLFRHLRRPLDLPKGYRVGGVLLFGYPDITFHRATCPEPILAKNIPPTPGGVGNQKA